MHINRNGLPRWAACLLRRMLPRETRRGALQEFEETYAALADLRQRPHANLWLLWQLMLMWPPLFKMQMIWSLAMVKSYMKLALRFMQKQKRFTVINMFCLAVGLAACLLALLYVQHEHSYNRFHPHAERLYRVDSDVFMRSRWKSFNYVPASVGPALVEGYLEIEDAVRLAWPGSIYVSRGQKQFSETQIYLTDPSFFSMFNFKVRYGDVGRALLGQGEVVLSARMAKKYFGDADPVGETLSWTVDGETERLRYTVVAVLENAPANSGIEYGFLFSLDRDRHYFPRLREFDDIGDSVTFVRLSKDISPRDVEVKLAGFQKRHYPAAIAEKRRFHLIHLLSLYSGHGAKSRMQFFSTMALVVLAIAVFNYINLSLARALKRHREVGMRKVMGAGRRQLFLQFIGESVAFAVGGWLLAMVLVTPLTGWMNQNLGLQLPMGGVWTPFFIGSGLALAVLTGGLAGCYPAIVLSRQPPITVLQKRQTQTGRRAFTLGKVLVVLQFAVSSYFICSSLVMLRQLRYLGRSDAGVALENRLSVYMEQPLSFSRMTGLKMKLLQLKGVERVACVSRTPTSPLSMRFLYPKPFNGASEFDVQVRGDYIKALYCDADFVETLGLTVVEGRDFSPGGSPSFLINERARTAFNAQRNIGPGSVVQVHTGDDVMKSMGIRGVVKNFHVMSRRWAMAPVVLSTEPPPESDPYRYLVVQYSDGAAGAVLQAVHHLLNREIPNLPVTVSFMTQEWQAGNAGAAREFHLGAGIALLTAVISGLGLYGLASFMLEQRLHEVGVRKVLGAGGGALVRAMGQRYLIWILLANGLALPLAFHWARRFLSDYAYRITLNGSTFMATLLLGLLLLGLTVGMKIFRTARLNPVDVLRCD